MEQQPTLTIQKCWEYSDKTVTLLCTTRALEGAKGYLTIDCNQATFGIRLDQKKKSAEPKPGAVTSLLRKHLLRAKIYAILQQHGSHDLWIMIERHRDAVRQIWMIALFASKPPQLTLINADKTSLVRFSTAAIYTKLQQFQGDLPDAHHTGFRNILPELLQPQCSEAPKADQPPSQETRAVAPEQKSLAARLRRKLKTLNHSLKKEYSHLPHPTELAQLTLKAQLLVQYSHEVLVHAASIVLPGQTTEQAEDITIELDPGLSVGQNIQSYFDRLKKRQRADQIGRKLIAKLEYEIAALTTVISRLGTTSLTPPEIAALQTQYGLKPAERLNRPSHQAATVKPGPYRLFQIPQLGKILVGKGAEENDLLTKMAKANDVTEYFTPSCLESQHNNTL